MRVLGISGLNQNIAFKRKWFSYLSERQYRMTQGFDSAAALVSLRGITAAAEERFSRQKSTSAFPTHAINFCLQKEKLQLQDIDYIAHNFDYQPFAQTYENNELNKARFAEVYSRAAQLQQIETHFGIDKEISNKFISVPHHLAHAASTFYPSGFHNALILVVDGMGERESLTVATGENNAIKTIQQISESHSLGVLYGLFTHYLGFEFGLDEYKIMGLAPYGDSRRFYYQILNLIHFNNDGTFTIPILCKNVSEEQRETYSSTLNALTELFGPARRPQSELSQKHKDLAASLQQVLQTVLIHVLKFFQSKTGLENLCLAGGVALNCSANGVINRSGLFKNIYVQPAAGDDGSALGAALYVYKKYEPFAIIPFKNLPFYGPQFSSNEIASILERYVEYPITWYQSHHSILGITAEYLTKGAIVAWFQQEMEFGPRALGNRSILADPRNPEIKEKINRLVKKREDFRPFAPAVNIEYASKYFEVEEEELDRYQTMLFTVTVREQYRQALPAVTHVDGSARIQTVIKKNHPQFWGLIEAFRKITNIPILLNTSYNTKGEPIVCTPQDAIETFIASELDLLIMNDFIISKK